MGIFDSLAIMSDKFVAAGAELAMTFAGDDSMWKIFALAIGLEIVFIAYRMLSDRGSWIQEVVEMCIVGVLVGGAVAGWGEVRDLFKGADQYAAKILPGAERGLTSATVVAINDALGPLLKSLLVMPSLTEVLADQTAAATATAARTTPESQAKPTK